MKLVFGLTVALGMTSPLHAFETAAAPTAHARLSNPLDDLRLEDFAVTRERPLFSQTRRPPPRAEPYLPPPQAAPSAVVEKVVVPERPHLELVGTVVGKFKTYVLLRNLEKQNVVRLREGDEQDGWRVGAVGLRSVALERRGQVEMLMFAGPATSDGASDPQLAGPADADQPSQSVARVGFRRSETLQPPP